MPPDLSTLLTRHGIRPTRQRRALAALLLEGPRRHVTAEALHQKAVQAGHPISLGTVYNTLHQLRAAGLVTEIIVEPGRTWFDTHTAPHVHIYREDTGELFDGPMDLLDALGEPALPDDVALVRTDVVFRVRGA